MEKRKRDGTEEVSQSKRRHVVELPIEAPVDVVMWEACYEIPTPTPVVKKLPTRRLQKTGKRVIAH